MAKTPYMQPSSPLNVDAILNPYIMTPLHGSFIVARGIWGSEFWLSGLLKGLTGPVASKKSGPKMDPNLGSAQMQ